MQSPPEPDKQQCGVVMPISAIDGCPASHWTEVKAILYDAINQAGYEPRLVSEADNIGIIQQEIVQNLYSDSIVVCDVSCRNPNVMFELGMRLAFDKPTVIVKDDLTDYTFDTASIQHIPYPRDLRFPKIVEFKTDLIKKIQGTMKASADPAFSPFLKHFGTFRVAKLDSKEVSRDEYFSRQLEDIRRALKTLSGQIARRPNDLWVSTEGLPEEDSIRLLIRDAIRTAYKEGRLCVAKFNREQLMEIMKTLPFDCKGQEKDMLSIMVEERRRLIEMMSNSE